ncbi:cell division protein FtsZ [Buchnera aphidicola]|uniref:Cell division protein FtsZ n=1 Tax=Buchnera aphidicola str. USDA (Myzus persicae) TaxID=1009856 RepID=W0P072_BUCMP|nr:cell division protein FtsZ [Buchnera aphidicola]AHG60161.1 Ftsz [Buchnera aphidicola str. USDA (Myzus persicae)]AHG60740.1 Ftsz [Buchnera aphidicola str. W106 (Myzus persicae)]AHG61313.1 Ftsz [Buchnera aphidicola str. G002 (Myzus persicae)]AHG61886.1 Ftsz [Buchnera aphidicola str. F009 (Myzus persicae)]WAI03148.1 MAG: cell division protein FtsZ [Buchnera aphidicola (Myzus persicae)]
MFEPVELSNNAIIKVIGVGGGGGNAVEHMVREHIEGVEFFAVNTDAQALKKIEVEQTIQIGNNITKGLGAGANPEIGRTSAEEDKELLKSALDGSDMVFIAAGMGGGTGTGAAPVVAEIAKELGILTVAVVTKPFNFEGKKRMIVAEQGIVELSKYVDSLITIPNDKLLKVLSRGISLLDAFSAANNVLKGAVQGIAELITRPGLMNVDFADVRTVMVEMGYAMMGTGISSGENRAEEASEIAISSPLLEDIDLSGARGVLVNITAGFDLRLDEFETVGNTIRSFSSDNATVVIGTSLDPDMNDSLRVTVVATGIGIEKNLGEDINKIKNKSSREILMDYRYQYLNISPKKIDPKNIKKEIIDKENKKNKEPEYLDIPSFLRKKAD